MPEQLPLTGGVSQFGSAGFADGQSRLYQQKLLQQQQMKQQRQLQQPQGLQQQALQPQSNSGQQSQQTAPLEAAQDQSGSVGAAQKQNMLYQQKLQHQNSRQQLLQQQLQQLRQVQASGYSSYDQSSPGLQDGSVPLSAALPEQQSVTQQQQQPQQGLQFGAVGSAQAQNAMYQQKVLQQRQKQLPASGQADSEQLNPSGFTQSPLYQQQPPSGRQSSGVNSGQPDSGQLGSAQHAQTQAVMYQQKLQQMKQQKQQLQQQQQQRQQQQMQQASEPRTQAQSPQMQQKQEDSSATALPDRQQQQQLGSMQVQASSAPIQQLPATATSVPQAVISQQAAPAMPSESRQMGSIGFALAQNAKYQQLLQQQQLRRQQRQQQEQLQQQQQPPQQPPQQQQQPKVVPVMQQARQPGAPPQQQQQQVPIVPQAVPVSGAVVQQLMQQYAMTGAAFLNLAKLKRVPVSLRNPGPNPSLAGDLQIVEDISAQGQAQIYFTLKPGRSQQLMHFDPAQGQYERLQQPWGLDDAQSALLLTAKHAQRLLAFKDPGKCLN